MQFGTKMNRPAAKSTIQSVLEHEAACSAAIEAADACEANGLLFEKSFGDEPFFPAGKQPNAMTFNIDLHDAWTRA